MHITAKQAKRNKLKLLLLQIRKDATTEREEIEAFLKYSQIEPEQLDVFNVYRTHTFPIHDLYNYDGLLIGGSSDASVLNKAKYPFVWTCDEIVRTCYQQNIPVFASCFGYQIAIHELGGEVSGHKKDLEIGLHPINLTAAAKTDPLLCDLPDTFWAVCGHKEYAVKIPENALLLGSSEASYQIIRFKGKPFYGFQFHPELNSGDAIARIKRYQTRYFEDQQVVDNIINRMTQSTAQANSLLKGFIDKFVLQ